MSTRFDQPYNETEATQIMTGFGYKSEDIDTFIELLPPDCRKPDLITIDDTSSEIDHLHYRFRRLMMLLCEGLQRRDLPALHIFGVTRQNLIRVAQEIQDMIGIKDLHRFIHEQYLLHPYRRIPTGNYIITLVSTDGSLELLEIFRLTLKQCTTWHQKIDQPTRLFEDPDLLPKGIFERSLRQVKKSTEATEHSCVLCDSPYTFQEYGPSTPSPLTPRSAMRTPCNHEFCYGCLQNWRLEAINGRFCCPMCRLCLVCGKANCQVHAVTPEPAHPSPFQVFFDGYFKDKEALLPPLYGVDSPNVRRIRELTRALRVDYAYFHRKQEDPAVSEVEKNNAGKCLSRTRKDIYGTIAYILKRLAEPTLDEDSTGETDKSSDEDSNGTLDT